MKRLNELYDRADQFNEQGKTYSVIPDSMGYPVLTRGGAWTTSTWETVINVEGLASAVPFHQLTVVGEVTS